MTINVHETMQDDYRDRMVEVSVWHHVNEEDGELFKRYVFADPEDICLHHMRPWVAKHHDTIVEQHHGFCLLTKGHRGRHSTVVYYCDNCDRAVRGIAYRDSEVQFCFLCHRLATMMADSGVEWQRISGLYCDYLRSLPVRDPNRIDEIISELAAYWHAHPDMRLGQIISNATPDRLERVGDTGVRDPFYVEDDEILEGIRNLP